MAEFEEFEIKSIQNSGACRNQAIHSLRAIGSDK
jgi:hypothetical protein